jgi:site-specific recombinase XerD
MDDYRRENEELRVMGKGNKERSVPTNPATMTCLDRWTSVRGDEPGALLQPIRKGGRIERRAMTSQAVLVALTKRTKQAGLKRLSPHDLRRSFGTHLLENGADVFAVQRLMGHASPTTTTTYDRRDDRANREAIARLNVPV